MKTAVSLPDALFEAAELAARRLGISRSRLYAEAIGLFLEQHGSDGVTEELNRVYAELPSGLDPVLAQMQLSSTPEESW